MNDSESSSGDELVRSFLTTYRREEDEGGEGPASIVRPYTITRGRTEASRSDVRFESVIVATTQGHEEPGLAPELAALISNADRPRSIVEVAHRAGLPLGVALVLAGDAVDAGWLRCSAKAAHDRSFVQRVREGVRAL